MTESTLKPQKLNEPPIQEETVYTKTIKDPDRGEYSVMTVKRSLVHYMSPLSMEDLEKRIEHPDSFSRRTRYIQCPSQKTLAEAFHAIAKVKDRTPGNISNTARRFLQDTKGAVAFVEAHRRLVHIADEFGRTSSEPSFDSEVRRVVFVGVTVLPFSAARRLLNDCREGRDLYRRTITAFEDYERGFCPSYEDMAPFPVVMLANGSFFPITVSGDSVIDFNARTIYQLHSINHVCSFSEGKKTNLPMMVEHSFFKQQSGAETRTQDWPENMPHRFGHPAGAHCKLLRELEQK